MYNVFSVVPVFSIIGLGRILISDLVVTNLLMHSLPGMILLYLAVPFFTPKVFLDELFIMGEGNQACYPIKYKIKYYTYILFQ